VDTAPGARIWRAPALHRNSGVAWELIPVARTCGDIREFYNRSYSPPLGG
jgi:hypothetical protein